MRETDMAAPSRDATKDERSFRYSKANLSCRLPQIRVVEVQPDLSSDDICAFPLCGVLRNQKDKFKSMINASMCDGTCPVLVQIPKHPIRWQGTRLSS